MNLRWLDTNINFTVFNLQYKLINKLQLYCIFIFLCWNIFRTSSALLAFLPFFVFGCLCVLKLCRRPEMTPKQLIRSVILTKVIFSYYERAQTAPSLTETLGHVSFNALFYSKHSNPIISRKRRRARFGMAQIICQEIGFVTRASVAISLSSERVESRQADRKSRAKNIEIPARYTSARGSSSSTSDLSVSHGTSYHFCHFIYADSILNPLENRSCQEENNLHIQ